LIEKLGRVGARLVSGLVSHVGELDVRVHTANTLTFGDLEENETLVAPASAPRVLNLPVVVVAIGVLLEHATVALARVPPLVDGAVSDGIRRRLGLGLWTGISVVIGGLLGVADEDDGVIKASRAAVIDTNNAGLVVLEVATAGIDSDGQRLLLQLVLHPLDALAGVDPTPAGDLTNNLVSVVRAGTLCARSSRSVGVVRVEHGTMLGLEVPGGGHPAAAAAPEAEVLPKELHVARIIPERAINKVLLGEADGRRSVLGCDAALESRVGSEGPARAAATLILDTEHGAVVSPIDSGGSDDAEAALCFVVVELRAVESVLFLPAEHLAEFGAVHIGELVDFVFGGIGLAGGRRDLIELPDLSKVVLEDLGALDHFTA